MQNEALGRASGIPEDQLKQLQKTNRKIYEQITSSDHDDDIEQRLINILTSASSDDLSEQDRRNQAEAQIQQLLSPWMRYFLKNDPADYLKNVHCPVLALNGEKDLQVPAQIGRASCRDRVNSRVVVVER